MKSLRTIGLLCLALAPVLGLAQDEAEAPPGYEDAPVVSEPNPVLEAAVADVEQPQDNVEIPQGYEDAPVAGDPVPLVEGEEGEMQQAEIGVEVMPENLDANVASLEKQLLPQFEQLWKVEVGFVQRVCELDPAQREQIQAAKEACTTAAARKYAIARSSRERLMNQPRAVRSTDAANPRKLLQKQMEQLVTKQLRADQVTQYRDECHKRDLYRKHMSVLGLVARIDEELLLTAQQHEELVESLVSNYQDAWGYSLEVFEQNRQYLPELPDQYFIGLLSETQLAVWQGTQKLNVSGLGGFEQAVLMVDDALLIDDDATKEVIADEAATDAFAEEVVIEIDGD